MPVIFRIMPVWMAVNEISVPMCMVVNMIVWRNRIHAAPKRAQIQPPKQNQHKCHAKFQSHSETFRDYDAEHNDRSAHQEQGDAMSDSPENSGHRRSADLTLPADNCCYCDHMIGVGGVP